MQERALVKILPLAKKNAWFMERRKAKGRKMAQKKVEYEADLQIGPTDQGMVRLIVTHSGGVINMDFDAEEAAEIAEEILAAAKRVND